MDLQQLLAAEFRELGSSGRVHTREEIVQMLPAGPPVVAISDFHASLLSDGVVLVTYRSARDSRMRSGQTAIALRSSVWVWRDSRWQIVFHQGTPQGTPAASTG